MTTLLHKKFFLYMRCLLPIVVVLFGFILETQNLQQQRFIFVLLLLTYPLDGFLFFYYKKNAHLNLGHKQNIRDGLRLVLVLVFYYFTRIES